VVSNLNALFEMQSEVIQTNGGDIDKFVGDQVMAIFSGPDSALHACSTAAEIDGS
jgi:class 3 adenylate cyclase